MNTFTSKAAGIIAGLALIGGLAAGCSEKGLLDSASPTLDPQQTAATTAAPAAAATSVQTNARPAQLTVAEVVKIADPAIVRIETGGGVGSGFIVSTDGYIVTNNHVVLTRTGKAATTVNVTLSDGSRVAGTVVGADPRADIAIVKIDGAKFQPLKLGRLEDVEIGQDVIAIGYALDLTRGEGPSYSVTRGIVSQKNRAIAENSDILGAVQTDAAINHGNSGGPLINLYGEVIGVNTSLIQDPTNPGSSASGIGFAVGVDMVKAVYEEIRANGAVNRGLLGVANFASLRPAKARELGLPDSTMGIIVPQSGGVAAGGPADIGGIRGGDVITKIGTSEIRNEADLAVALIRNHAGQKVDVQILRGAQKLTVQVTLGTPQ